MRISRAAAYCLAAWLIVACAAAPGVQEEAAVRSADDAASEPTSEEVMYRVFAAEYLGSEGDLQGAVGEYLAAAMVSDDPEIARRATRV
ncbi:MAG: hypothetical protein OQK01_14290, partial [Xanthomonadales bacterium]|nr:hypothetical protein [Xanthomonadales bacterium]